MSAITQINNPILQVGSQGALVKELQQLLNLFNYKLTVDGDFGARTGQAVKAFQTSKALVADGIVGHATWTTLYKSVLAVAPNAMPILQLGRQGEAVQLLQKTLNQSSKVVTVDGNFGIATEAAVKTLQKNNRLTVDGIVGSKTWVVIAKLPQPL
jgi:peptidoglycan hydrolase-like protein with peptidoglycan-binding domain